MPYISPTPGDVHVSRPLTNILVGYMQPESAFVADKVFPNIPVTKQADAYFEYDRDDWNLDEMEERAPGAESAGSGYELGTNAYYAPVKALHKDIPDQLRGNADDPLNLDRDATMFLSHKFRLNRERRWAARYFTTGVWTFQADGVDSGATAAGSFDPTNLSSNDKLRWNDGASNPIEDMRQGMTKMQERTGFRPNKLVLGRPVFDVLVDHPDFIARMDRGQTQGAAMANRAAIAAILELDEVVVMDAIYNSAKKKGTTDTETNAFIGGKHAGLYYANPTPSVLTPSAGYTFSWTGYLAATQQGARMKKFRMEHLASDRVEIEAAYDQKLVGADLGYFFNGIIA
jgi:hypothetical protein